MKRTILIILICLSASLLLPGVSLAASDQYIGDTAIYGGSPAVLQPNVLIIIDTSGSMSGEVPAGAGDNSFSSAMTYTAVRKCRDANNDREYCRADAVYDGNYDVVNDSVNNIVADCGGATPKATLINFGVYTGPNLKSSGTGCRNSNTRTYYTGNYINWLEGVQGATEQKIIIAKRVIKNLLATTNNVRFGLMRYDAGGFGNGGQFSSTSFLGSTYITTVKGMDDVYSGTSPTTNRYALMAAVDSLSLNGITPLGESLFEAMRYFKGQESAFGHTVGETGSPPKYVSPIQAGCQKNYVIVVTDGMANADDDSDLRTICANGDCDGDGKEPTDLDHVLDDVAKYLYDSDLSSSYTGTQNVTTFAIGFGFGNGTPSADETAADALLTRTTDGSHGHGQYFKAGGEQALANALTSVMAEVNSVNTSFVAPVVPVSPDNRTFSGNRIYMGFFKPLAPPSKFWSGNLKKYGLDADNNILDATGTYATYVCSACSSTTRPWYDTRDNALFPLTATNGSFRTNARSYWSTSIDSGEVEVGGVGDLLQSRTTTRQIFTYFGNSNLTDVSNSLISTNPSCTPGAFGLATATDVDNLINMLNGIDAYDWNGNNDKTEKRDWVLGDVLHSKPQIVSYQTFSVDTQETTCSANKSYVYVGTNDGMLHAFKDCDGSEAWAFVPPDLLPFLQYLGPTGSAHTYYVDASPSLYVYNQSRTGNIDAATDKVVLLVSLRRGGGLDNAPTQGFLYALDVTDPTAPVFLWRKSNAELPGLAETWSEPSFGKIKIGSDIKIVAFIGGGYDNCYEDVRYGNTQYYPSAASTCESPLVTSDSLVTTSTGSVTAASLTNPKGRALHVVDIATVNATTGVQTLSSTGSVETTFTGMEYSIAGKPKIIDRSFDGYDDTVYAGDLGGNIWRFNIVSTNKSNWAATKIFSANPGYAANAGSTTVTQESPAKNGRKILYDPATLILEDQTVRVIFGTGDREHPLNTAVTDRIYTLIDRGQTAAKNESNLVDLTHNDLQEANTTDASTVLNTLNALSSSSNYGWYIRLDQNAGEKVLSPAVVVSGTRPDGSSTYSEWLTTWSPDSSVTSTDPCNTSNLGTSRLYVVDYQNGMALYNFDTTNDSGVGNTNTYSRTGDTNLRRSDRSKAIGSGIASGGVVVTAQDGSTSVLVSSGGNITINDAGTHTPAQGSYWRQKVERINTE